jgi:YVTN family beta-propeller protein
MRKELPAHSADLAAVSDRARRSTSQSPPHARGGSERVTRRKINPAKAAFRATLAALFAALALCLTPTPSADADATLPAGVWNDRSQLMRTDFVEVGQQACAPTLADTGARINAGSAPARAVITPNGSEVYVTNNSSNDVSVISTATDAVTFTIPVGSSPDAIVVTPDGSKVYVGNNGGSVSVISTAAHAVTATVFPGGPVRDLAITPDGSKVYLAMEFSGLKSMDTATNSVVSVSGFVCPEGVGVTPDGSTLYVNYQCGGPGGSGGHDAVGRFNASTGAFTGSITGLPNVGGRLFVSPDGAQVWENGGDACVAPFYDHAGCPFVPSGVVNVISASTNTLQHSIGFSGFTPGHVSFLPDGSRALIGNGANLSLFDTSTFALVGNIPVPASGSVVFAPNGKAYAPLPGQNQVAVLSLAGCPQQCAPPPPGMVAWWPGDNNALDIQGVNNGTLQNGATFAPGKVSQAFSLDGVDDYVRFGNILRGLNGGFTLDAWIRTTATVGNKAIVAKYETTGGSWTIRTNESDPRKVDFTVCSPDCLTLADAVQLVSTSNINDGEWHFIAATFDGSTQRLYVDGALEASGTNTNPAWADNHYFCIGAFCDSAGNSYLPFGGLIDEVEVFNRALSATEIRSIFNAGGAGKCKPTPADCVPVVNAPPAVNVTTGADATACGVLVPDSALGSATASDVCDGALAVTRSGVPDGNFFPVGTTHVSYSATDGAGHTTTATQDVTVVDNTPPVIAGASPSANEIVLDFNDGLLPSAHGWTFQGFDQSNQPILESQAASVSGGVLHLDTTQFGGVFGGNALAFWRKPTTGIDTANYEYEIRMRADAPNSTRNCSGGLLGAGIEVRESFDSDFTLMQPQLHLGGFSPTPAGGPCFFASADGSAFHTYKVVVRNDTQASVFVDGVLSAQGTPVRPNTLSLEAVFGDITTSGGNSTADMDYLRVASAASRLADVHADADASSCSATVNVAQPEASDNCAGVTVAGVRGDNQPLAAPYPVGTTTITWTATDAAGNTATATQSVIVADNTPPVVTPPANVSVSAAADSCSASVNPGTATFGDNCAGGSVAGVRSDHLVLSAPYPVGTTTITWTATDASGNAASATQTVAVTDAQPPGVTAPTASPSGLWPPNHTMRDVTVSYDATDNCGGVTCVISSVTSNEPVNGTGDGDTAPDWLIVDGHHVRLRAERAGGGSGRVYTITVRCTDDAGNATAKTVTVTVPKSQK